jgi:small subunit ribosomal protein S1
MNDKEDVSTPKPENPATPPATPPAEPAAPGSAPAPAEGKRRPFRAGKPPALKVEEVYGTSRPRLKDLDAEIEQELQEALGGFAEIDNYDKQAGSRAPAPPGPKKGKVVRVHGQDVFVDVPGGRSQGVLSADQFSEGVPPPGTEVEVTIEGYDEANGLLLLTRKGAAVHADWSTVQIGMTVEARVTGTNKGGLAVDVNGIRGFMPISQIDLFRVERPEEYVNQRLRCMVAEVNPEERNLVVSRRALLEREREEAREKLWAELAEGQVRQGVVRSVKDFGAFVDMGGVDGLVHVSEMSWSRVQDAAQFVQPGQTVQVVVLKIDHEKRKVSLGMKQLVASPWDAVEEHYPPGSVVKGKVSRVMNFGAFVELEPGVEGLIHISELASQRVRRVTDIVKPDQEVQVLVLNVDREARRMSLSLKGAAKAEEPPAEEEEAAPAEVKPPRPRTTPLRGGIGDSTTEPPLS